MAVVTRGISRGQVIPLVFGQTDLAATQTDAQLGTAIGETGQVTDGYTIPWDFDIIGVGWTLSTAATAGVLTFGATINGTEDTDTSIVVPADSTTVKGYRRVPRGKASGVAGSTVGAEVTTGGTFAPITADLSVTVYVLAYLDGI